MKQTNSTSLTVTDYRVRQHTHNMNYNHNDNHIIYICKNLHIKQFKTTSTSSKSNENKTEPLDVTCCFGCWPVVFFKSGWACIPQHKSAKVSSAFWLAYREEKKKQLIQLSFLSLTQIDARFFSILFHVFIAFSFTWQFDSLSSARAEIYNIVFERLNTVTVVEEERLF